MRSRRDVCRTPVLEERGSGAYGMRSYEIKKKSKQVSPRFTRRREDFICLHCSFQVKGTGYTNHCPNCLWSRHVDIQPGDRAADCQGMMQPVGIRIQKGEYDIQHRCLQCGKMMYCKSSSQDDFEMILKVSKQE